MIVPAWAARRTCGICASIGLERSWTISVMPWALAQQRRQERAGLRLAGLERHARPAQLAAQPHEPPVVGALVHEQRLAGRDAVHVDPVGLQVVGERLLDVEQHPVEPRVLVDQAVEDRVDVRGLVDRAVEVGGQPVDAFLDGDLADLDAAGRSPSRGRRRAA